MGEPFGVCGGFSEKGTVSEVRHPLNSWDSFWTTLKMYIAPLQSLERGLNTDLDRMLSLTTTIFLSIPGTEKYTMASSEYDILRGIVVPEIQSLPPGKVRTYFTRNLDLCEQEKERASKSGYHSSNDI